MAHCLRRAIIFILFFLPFNSYVWAQAGTGAIENELAAFREADDLEGWIYHRIEYADKKPSERLGFLMQSQQRAWRSYKSYSERTAWLYLMATQGYYQLQSGDILSSINSYENALQFYESYPLPDADVEEYVLKPLGNNYTRLADYNTALFIHRKSLDAAMKKGDRNQVASVYSNMAACARWKGDLMQAVDFCKEGISYADKKKLLYGLLLSTYADVLAEQQRYDTAAVLSRQSLQQLRGHGNDMQALYWYTSALQIASRIGLMQGEFKKATEHVNTARKLFEKHYPDSRQREKAKLHVLLGDIYKASGDREMAFSSYHKALVTLLPDGAMPDILAAIPRKEVIYSENTFVDALAGKAATASLPSEAIRNYMACFEADKKLRSAFFYTESKYRELEVNRSRVSEAMRIANGLQLADKSNAGLVLLISEISKAQVLSDERRGRSLSYATDTINIKITRLQEAVNYYQHELVFAADKENIGKLLQGAEYELALLMKKLNRPEDHDLLSGERLQQMLKSLPQNVTVLEFFEGIDSSYIIEADATGVQSIRRIPGRKTSDSIRQFMQRWFSSGAGAMLNAPKSFYEASHHLYKDIFGDYAWKKGRQYILIPDGGFSYLPFDALVTEPVFRNNYGDWPWLFKKAVISQAWSLQTWHEQQHTKYGPAAFAGFFVGNDRAGQQLKLSVEQEYKSIQKLVRGQYFLNAEATWQHFNNAADSAGVLHIGGHAMSIAGDSLPFLQLYDKPFYLFDLRYKKFSPALVVLGACKTASGQLLQGEGLNSLSRGFTAAGAGGVVSGLWNINDETAIAFMQSFYEQLKEHDPAVALQLAREKWLSDHADNPALQLPYYWAGLVYSGHLQQVKLEGSNNRWWYWSLALILLLFLGILFRFIQSRQRLRM
jgi:CHAT domain-containing protein